MLYFPQPSTGSTVQYPIQKRRIQRTIVNDCQDGRQIRLADTGAIGVRWDLQYESLSDAETTSLQDFFVTAQGRLNSFTFLDPTANLLLWSEDLSQAAWVMSPLLQLTAGIDDALGGNHGTRVTNPTGSALTILQTLNAPRWFQYCLSLYGRSSSNGTITLERQSDTATFAVPSSWKRIVFSGQSSGTEGTVTVGFAVPAGQSLDIFGIQVEAQAGASKYKATAQNGGVYPNARFGEDAFSLTTSAPNRNAIKLSVVAAGNGTS